jgi:hypothetical protein
MGKEEKSRMEDRQEYQHVHMPITTPMAHGPRLEKLLEPGV